MGDTLSLLAVGIGCNISQLRVSIEPHVRTLSGLLGWPPGEHSVATFAERHVLYMSILNNFILNNHKNFYTGWIMMLLRKFRHRAGAGAKWESVCTKPV